MYSNNVVPKNSLQHKFVDNTQEHLAPDPFAKQTAGCTIVKVYDADTIEEEELSNKLKKLIAHHPGWLYAKIRMLDQLTEYIVPFRDPEDFIYSVYGNRVQLEGRHARLTYVNQDPRNGSIQLERTYDQKSLSLLTATQVYDVGGII